MRKMLTSFAITLAGLGVLGSGSRAEETSRRLHDELRSRIRPVIEREGTTSDRLREALAADPAFDRILAYLLRRSKDSLHSADPDCTEDAIQETVLRIWSRHPEVFLLTHDELLRYLKTATRRNLCSELSRASGERGTLARSPIDLDEQGITPTAPADVDHDDLLAELTARLDPESRRVLEAYLEGEASARRAAEATGLTRYAAGCAARKIGAELTDLLDDDATPFAAAG